MAEQNLNKKTSIVDYLKSEGRDSSFGERAKLAKREGLVKSESEFVGSASQNTALLERLRSRDGTSEAPQSPDSVKTEQDAESFINAGQDEDMEAASEGEDPGIRPSTQTALDIYSRVESAIKPKTDAPEAPDLTQRYEELSSEAGIDTLQERLNEVELEEQEIRAQMRERTTKERGKPVATNVISGRISEVERQERERLDYVLREKQFLSNQVQDKQKTIETILELDQTNFSNAQSVYESKFNQNLQSINLAQDVLQSERSLENQIAENSRANLQVIYNQASDGGINFDNLSESQKTHIAKLEMEAGLPSGFYKQLEQTNPGGKVISTTTRTSGGKKYADNVIRNADGSISVQSTPLGGVDKEESDLTEAQVQREALSMVSKQIQDRTTDDGYLKPTDWNKARSRWRSAGFDVTSFDEQFSDLIDASKQEDYKISDPMMGMGF